MHAIGRCLILPPYLTEQIRDRASSDTVRRAMVVAQEAGLRVREVRRVFLGMTVRASLAGPAPRLARRIYDCENSQDLQARLVRKEGAPVTNDPAVDEAYDYSGATFDFFSKTFGRASVDNKNLRLTSSVHYRELPDQGYDNAFWNGSQMVYGDGDGELFQRFTIALDVVGHELTHGVTQYEAGLDYEGQSGSLNEHFSDVFGVLVRQWKNGESEASSADWTIGRGLFKPERMQDMALRSMSAPGTAYEDPELGKDPQPDHMRDYVEMPNTPEGDWGGVHFNSGIPNKAFWLAATGLEGPAWEMAGRIWYVTLTERLGKAADFKKCARETMSVADDLFGTEAAQAVAKAWEGVGVLQRGEGPKGLIARLDAAHR